MVNKIIFKDIKRFCSQLSNWCVLFLLVSIISIITYFHYDASHANAWSSIIFIFCHQIFYCTIFIGGYLFFVRRIFLNPSLFLISRIKDKKQWLNYQVVSANVISLIYLIIYYGVIICTAFLFNKTDNIFGKDLIVMNIVGIKSFSLFYSPITATITVFIRCFLLLVLFNNLLQLFSFFSSTVIKTYRYIFLFMIILLMIMFRSYYILLFDFDPNAFKHYIQGENICIYILRSNIHIVLYIYIIKYIVNNILINKLEFNND